MARAANSAAAAPAPLLAADLRQDCEQHKSEAEQPRGWARSRFEQCHRLDQKINLYAVGTNEYKGFIQYDLWVLARSNDGDRTVTFEIRLENAGIASQLNADLGYVSLDFAGCNTLNVSCNGATTYRSDKIENWFHHPEFATIVATSPNNVGAGAYHTVDLLAQMSLFVEYRDGITIPYSNPTAVINASRFDSAGAPLGGKFHGAVFTDFVPTLELDARQGSNHRSEARHVLDALQRPRLTFPSVVGKSVPGAAGSNRPLHRLMPKSYRDQNHDGAVSICTEVWGPEYPAGGLQCDEYPFQSTYEGSSTSTGGNPRQWHGSARPIDGAENGAGGTLLGNFYGAQRLIDTGDPAVSGSYGDAFYVKVLT
ncbi:hypothetical protein AB0H83_25345 [Dactylosporangium sp. NPDC050688]|uniref:NucA/NucB deoxyribonuclease domain-containing protein n=1 Tax=Dactylosporangium sp. NPDC050688 TaxID=3157217 RepID=UPI0033C9408C